jgi:hypothetical protein
MVVLNPGDVNVALAVLQCHGPGRSHTPSNPSLASTPEGSPSLTPLSPWWWGLRPSVTPAQVLEHLSRFYHVENDEVSVRRNRYGCFLVNFSAAGSSIEFCMQDTIKELI